MNKSTPVLDLTPMFTVFLVKFLQFALPALLIYALACFIWVRLRRLMGWRR